MRCTAIPLRWRPAARSIRRGCGRMDADDARATQPSLAGRASEFSQAPNLRLKTSSNACWCPSCSRAREAARARLPRPRPLDRRTHAEVRRHGARRTLCGGRRREGPFFRVRADIVAHAQALRADEGGGARQRASDVARTRRARRARTTPREPRRWKTSVDESAAELAEESDDNPRSPHLFAPV